ncbi:hypothetical protein BXZ70DRAFT_1011248 [Cristinia sonorae]|uniref:Uncharacterized protein n=1 Tax=Cristinia sonorae TaxID=1940300 RepID=A0A8K0UGN2_9AGAR|nr:hypothetical protein BXZ70DRAFT_1011248 [Cristinia sonorae]
MFATVAFAQANDDLTINTPPSIVQCKTTMISWDGGVSPFDLVRISISLSMHNTETPNLLLSINLRAKCSVTEEGVVVEDFPNILPGSSFDFFVDFPAGATLGFTVTDNNGDKAETAPVTVQESDESTCLSD